MSSSTSLEGWTMSIRTRQEFTISVALAVFFLSFGIASSARGRPGDSAKGTGASQPIAFNHKLHSAQKLECTSCHDNPDPGESMTIPDAEFCMNCHQSIAAEKPTIKKLAQFARAKQAVPWERIYSLPAFVFWSHRTHLAARQQCAACHGDVASMEIVRATNVTTMDACIDCHDKKDANTGCSTCHEGRSS